MGANKRFNGTIVRRAADRTLVVCGRAVNREVGSRGTFHPCLQRSGRNAGDPRQHRVRPTARDGCRCSRDDFVRDVVGRAPLQVCADLCADTSPGPSSLDDQCDPRRLRNLQSSGGHLRHRRGGFLRWNSGVVVVVEPRPPAGPWQFILAERLTIIVRRRARPRSDAGDSCRDVFPSDSLAAAILARLGPDGRTARWRRDLRGTWAAAGGRFGRIIKVVFARLPRPVGRAGLLAGLSPQVFLWKHLTT